MADGRLLATLRGHQRTPWCVAWHPTRPGVLASGSLAWVHGGLPAEVRLWDVSQATAAVAEAAAGGAVGAHDHGGGGSGALLAVAQLTRNVLTLAFHPDGDVLLLGSGADLRLWWLPPVFAAADAGAAAAALTSAAAPLAPRGTAQPVLSPIHLDGRSWRAGGGAAAAPIPPPPQQQQQPALPADPLPGPDPTLPLAVFPTNVRGLAFTPGGRHLLTALERAWPVGRPYDADGMACAVHLWAWDADAAAAAVAGYHRGRAAAAAGDWGALSSSLLSPAPLLTPPHSSAFTVAAVAGPTQPIVWAAPAADAGGPVPPQEAAADAAAGQPSPPPSGQQQEGSTPPEPSPVPSVSPSGPALAPSPLLLSRGRHSAPSPTSPPAAAAFALRRALQHSSSSRTRAAATASVAPAGSPLPGPQHSRADAGSVGGVGSSDNATTSSGSLSVSSGLATPQLLPLASPLLTPAAAAAVATPVHALWQHALPAGSARIGGGDGAAGSGGQSPPATAFERRSDKDGVSGSALRFGASAGGRSGGSMPGSSQTGQDIGRQSPQVTAASFTPLASPSRLAPSPPARMFAALSPYRPGSADVFAAAAAAEAVALAGGGAAPLTVWHAPAAVGAALAAGVPTAAPRTMRAGSPAISLRLPAALFASVGAGGTTAVDGGGGVSGTRRTPHGHLRPLGVGDASSSPSEADGDCSGDDGDGLSSPVTLGDGAGASTSPLRTLAASAATMLRLQSKWAADGIESPPLAPSDLAPPPSSRPGSAVSATVGSPSTSLPPSQQLRSPAHALPLATTPAHAVRRRAVTGTASPPEPPQPAYLTVPSPPLAGAAGASLHQQPQTGDDSGPLLTQRFAALNLFTCIPAPEAAGADAALPSLLLLQQPAALLPRAASPLSRTASPAARLRRAMSDGPPHNRRLQLRGGGGGGLADNAAAGGGGGIDVNGDAQLFVRQPVPAASPPVPPPQAQEAAARSPPRRPTEAELRAHFQWQPVRFSGPPHATPVVGTSTADAVVAALSAQLLPSDGSSGNVAEAVRQLLLVGAASPVAVGSGEGAAHDSSWESAAGAACIAQLVPRANCAGASPLCGPLLLEGAAVLFNEAGMGVSADGGLLALAVRLPVAASVDSSGDDVTAPPTPPVRDRAGCNCSSSGDDTSDGLVARIADSSVAAAAPGYGGTTAADHMQWLHHALADHVAGAGSGSSSNDVPVGTPFAAFVLRVAFYAAVQRARAAAVVAAVSSAGACVVADAHSGVGIGAAGGNGGVVGAPLPPLSLPDADTASSPDDANAVALFDLGELTVGPSSPAAASLRRLSQRRRQQSCARHWLLPYPHEPPRLGVVRLGIRRRDAFVTAVKLTPCGRHVVVGLEPRPASPSRRAPSPTGSVDTAALADSGEWDGGGGGGDAAGALLTPAGGGGGAPWHQQRGRTIVTVLPVEGALCGSDGNDAGGGSACPHCAPSVAATAPPLLEVRDVGVEVNVALPLPVAAEAARNRINSKSISNRTSWWTVVDGTCGRGGVGAPAPPMTSAPRQRAPTRPPMCEGIVYGTRDGRVVFVGPPSGRPRPGECDVTVDVAAAAPASTGGRRRDPAAAGNASVQQQQRPTNNNNS